VIVNGHQPFCCLFRNFASTDTVGCVISVERLWTSFYLNCVP
jgi:hypothetical protein